MPKVDLNKELERHGAPRGDTTMGGTFEGNETEHIEAAMQEIPHEHRHKAKRAVGHAINYLEKFYALVAISQYLRELEQSNSTITLAPSVGFGTAVTRGLVYNAFPSVGGVVQTTPFQFSIGMFFKGVITSNVDTLNGWQIVAGSFKFSDDPIAGVYQDTSFNAFEVALTSGPSERLPIGMYSRRRFLAPTNLQCQVVNPAGTTAMFAGITIAYLDTRCKNEQMNMDSFERHDLGEHVRELIGRRHAGAGPHNLFRLPGHG